MVRRLVTFALAFVVTGVPLAGYVCEALCTEHVGHSIEQIAPTLEHRHDSHPSDHSHSDAPPAADSESAALGPLSHPCIHLDAVVIESRKLTPSPVVKAVETRGGFAPLIGSVLPLFERNSRHGPPVPVRATSPLRI